MRITRVIGMTLGGFVSLVGAMSVAGLAWSNIWFRLAVGVLIIVAVPSLLADRMLKRTNANLGTKGALGMVGDVFAIVLLGLALLLVAAESMTKNLVAHEADHYARANSIMMARAVYFIAGVSPVFPNEKPALPKSGAGSASSSAAPPPSR